MLYITFVVGDNWHIATGQHYGDHIYLPSTGKTFGDQMDAIRTAYAELKAIYKSARIVSEKGLKDTYHNEIDVDGRQFDIYCIALKR